jgi:hypothetical protein
MPKYTVEIREHLLRRYTVEAASPVEVKRMYLEDENLLGPAHDCEVYDSSMMVVCSDGTRIDEIDIPDTLHFSSDTESVLCGDPFWAEATDEASVVTCTGCLAKLKDSEEPTKEG